MRLQKIILLFLIFASFAISQNKTELIRVLKINPAPCSDYEVYINGQLSGYTTPLGRYEFSYDTTQQKTYEVEFRDPFEKLSKKFSMTLGKNKNKLPMQFVFFTILKAYLPQEQIEGNFMEALKNFKDAGVTDVFIPVFYDGKLIFPSKIKNIKSSSKDYLREIIDSCRKLNMKPYATINALNWGKKGSANILNKEYLMVNKKGEYNKGEEKDLLFVSPANPDVVKALVEINRELAINYRDLFGIDYNYARFKKGSHLKAEEEDFGFEKNSVRLFKESNQLDPYKIKFDTTTGSNWMKWIAFRENLILDLVVKMVAAVKDTNKTFEISMHLDPNYMREYGLNLSGTNPVDIEQYVVPDYYYLEFSKADLKNELRMLDYYINPDNPFVEDDYARQRQSAFIPIIKNHSELSQQELDKFLDLLAAKGRGSNFAVYDYSVFKNPKYRKELLEIMFR